MYDTRTVFGRHVVTGDDTERTLSRIHPREERIVLQTYQVRTLISGYDLRLFLSAEFFLIRL